MSDKNNLDNPEQTVVAEPVKREPTWEEIRDSQHHQDEYLQKLERESTRDPLSGRIIRGPLGPDNNPDMKVFFTREPIHSKYLSAKHGEPTSVIKEFITIIPPRDFDGKAKQDLLTKHTIVEAIDMWRFPKEYDAFKQGKQSEFTKTAILLLDWPDIQQHADIISQLKAISVQTVEDLAKVSDFEGSKYVKNFKAWKQKAKAYVDRRNKPQELIDVEGKLEEQRLKYEADMKAMNDKLAAMLAIVESQRNANTAEPTKKSTYKRKGEADSE